jgi:mono/diheme cytochrome c family protein
MQSSHIMTIGRFSATLLACLAVLFACRPASAQSAAERGSAVVDTWCRMCHVRTDVEKSPDLAPPFPQIVARPGRNKAYLRAFLNEDHFPMTTFRLFDHEKDDVVAYLLSLKRE